MRLGHFVLSYIDSRLCFFSRFRVALRFKPFTDKDGIIMYCAENRQGIGDFVALIIHKRHLKLMFDIGDGVKDLTSNSTIEPGKWYQVNVSKNTRIMSLKLNTEPLVRQTIAVSLHFMSLKTLVYFGGIDRRKVLTNENIKVKTTFRGCLDKVGKFQFSRY